MPGVGLSIEHAKILPLKCLLSRLYSLGEEAFFYTVLSRRGREYLKYIVLII